MVSAAWQSDSVIHTHILVVFQILFPYKLSQHIEWGEKKNGEHACCTFRSLNWAQSSWDFFTHLSSHFHKVDFSQWYLANPLKCLGNPRQELTLWAEGVELQQGGAGKKERKARPMKRLALGGENPAPFGRWWSKAHFPDGNIFRPTASSTHMPFIIAVRTLEAA